MSRLRQWYEYLVTPELDWIQIEVSSHCNASCRYCPHTVFSDSWQSRHMSMATFERLIPAIKQAGLVHLQGWGEPLLNPLFPEMVRRAKEAGARVATTTNGILLDETMVDRLQLAGIDLISLSLAGVSAANDTFRSGTRFEDVVAALTMISRKRKRAGIGKPALHVSYLLLRSVADDLRRLPLALEDRGVDEIIVSTLDLVPSSGLSGETIAPSDDMEYERWRSFLEDVKRDAERRGMRLHYYLRHPGTRRSVCAENAGRALFVSADGIVAPCVFTNLPVADYSTALPKRTTFGNVNHQSLARIWRNRKYVGFREAMVGNQPPGSCADCPKLYLTEG